MRALVKIVVAISMAVLTVCALAQEKKTGVLTAADLKQIVPSTYFFAGQVAPVQQRNCAAVRLGSGKVIEAGLVDSSGYSTAIAAKYQGFLITEQKIDVEGKELAPGQYGFGFSEGKFRVMDVGENDVLLVDQQQDDKLQRPVPLKIVEQSGSYRLYAGKKFVTISAK